VEINTKGYILCPKCARRTKVKVIPSKTMIRRFPLYCSWCKQETVINYG